MPHLCYHNIRSRNKKTTLREQLELYSFSTKNTKGDKFITPYIIKRQAHYLKLIQNLIKLQKCQTETELHGGLYLKTSKFKLFSLKKS